MSMHGMLEMVQNHPTSRKVDGQWKLLKYTEPFSQYSRAKHWVDNLNNHCHDPTGLEEAWRMKWWAMRNMIVLSSQEEQSNGVPAGFSS